MVAAGGAGWQLGAVGGGRYVGQGPFGLSLCLGPSLCEELSSGTLSRRASSGYSPACRAEDGGFSPMQCDLAQGSCWCVLDSGEEVPGTRVAGSQLACESKL